MSLLSDLEGLVEKLEEAVSAVATGAVDVAGGLVHEAAELAKAAVDAVAGKE